MADTELIIKIHEDSYKATCRGSMLPPDVENVINAIKNGTPLSKTIDSLKELSKDHRHNFVGNSCEERAWRLGIEDSIDLILAESKGKE